MFAFLLLVVGFFVVGFFLGGRGGGGAPSSKPLLKKKRKKKGRGIHREIKESGSWGEVKTPLVPYSSSHTPKQTRTLFTSHEKCRFNFGFLFGRQSGRQTSSTLHDDVTSKQGLMFWRRAQSQYNVRVTGASPNAQAKVVFPHYVLV